MENDPPDATRIQSFSLPVEPQEDKPEEQEDAAPAEEQQAPAQPPASQDFPTRVQQIPPVTPPPAPEAPSDPDATRVQQIPPTPAYGQAPAYGQVPAYGQPTPPPNQYAVPAPGYQPPHPYQYGGYPPQPYGYAGAPPKTNGLAIASLVCSCIFFIGICPILGIIFGFVARSQINRTGENGRGTATAGIVIGFSVIALYILIIAVAFSVAATRPNG